MPKFYSTTTARSLDPKGYLEIEAPSEYAARLVSKHKLGKDWSFIYSEEQFEGQIEKWDLHPLHFSPIKVTENDLWYYEEQIKNKQQEDD